MEVLGILTKATLDNSNRIDNLTTEVSKYIRSTSLYILLGIGSLYLLRKRIKQQDITILTLEKKIEQLEKQ